jgi:hypothetical protein
MNRVRAEGSWREGIAIIIVVGIVIGPGQQRRRAYGRHGWRVQRGGFGIMDSSLDVQLFGKFR